MNDSYERSRISKKPRKPLGTPSISSLGTTDNGGDGILEKFDP